MNSLSTLRFLFALLLLQLALVGCSRPSNPTTAKGPGGYPVQHYNSAGQVIPWTFPQELAYPSMTSPVPDNNRLYRSADTPEIIAQYYMQKLAGAQLKEPGGKLHVVVSNEEYEIDIRSGGDQSEIIFTPLKLGQPTHSGNDCGHPA